MSIPALDDGGWRRLSNPQYLVAGADWFGIDFPAPRRPNWFLVSSYRLFLFELQLANWLYWIGWLCMYSFVSTTCVRGLQLFRNFLFLLFISVSWTEVRGTSEQAAPFPSPTQRPEHSQIDFASDGSSRRLSNRDRSFWWVFFSKSIFLV